MSLVQNGYWWDHLSKSLTKEVVLLWYSNSRFENQSISYDIEMLIRRSTGIKIYSSGKFDWIRSNIRKHLVSSCTRNVASERRKSNLSWKRVWLTLREGDRRVSSFENLLCGFQRLIVMLEVEKVKCLSLDPHIWRLGSYSICIM